MYKTSHSYVNRTSIILCQTNNTRKKNSLRAIHMDKYEHLKWGCDFFERSKPC